jgi:hypothetical protein
LPHLERSLKILKLFGPVNLAAFVVMLSAVAGAGRAKPMWTIGTVDGSTREFALAPGDYAKFKDDGYFAVGRSNSARDWPYIQPGPSDSWAGGRRHTFTVEFGVKSVKGAGDATLNIHLVDTQPAGPPTLRITVNGQPFERTTPKGSGNPTYLGNPEQGRASTVSVSFPVSLLREGSNTISIATVVGSWMLYDAIQLEAPGVEPGPAVETHVADVRSEQVILRTPDGPVQPLHIEIRHFGAPAPARFYIRDEERPIQLEAGLTRLDLEMPPVTRDTELPVSLVIQDGTELWSGKVTMKPVRPWTVFVLPHSHNDIGYTALQSDVLKKQIANLETAIALAKKTADYPEGARFKWNSEVLWSVDSYLKEATPEQKATLLDAIRRGWVELNALYANELTGLCRPEELVRLLQPSVRIARETGKPIPTAMISDVPGYTWGMVPVLAQAGVKYFSIGPNPNDRIGLTAKAWADKPFYWKSPSGKEKVLFWMTGTSYNWFHGQTLAQKGDSEMLTYLSELAADKYPYDYVQVRYTAGGDNGPPDPTLPDTVKAWNERYVSPRLALATTTEMFDALASKYGNTLPTASGDFTPYWEDGAASTALETAMNRNSAERLSQAGTLWSMQSPPASFPAGEMDDAWRDVVLYSEHTWGAHNSISEPDSDFVKGQWAVKRQFALDADRASHALLQGALAHRGDTVANAVDVFNTSSWDRTDLVTVSAALSRAGDRVVDGDGQAVPSQRLKTGELVFLARGVPAFGGRRYRVTGGAPPAGKAVATATEVGAGGLNVRVDPETGEITRLDSAHGNVAKRMNGYFYVPGADPKAAVTSGSATVSIVENGPLVASLEIRSAAPGANGLVRQVRVVDGLDRVEIADTLDKKAVRTKEGVHFKFDFNIPNGVVRMETPWAVVRPEVDQLPGACKNWFTVQRWVDVSNDGAGVTMAPLDAPLIEIGGITAELPWMSTIQPSQTIYSYVMNNYWHTNYKADQSGPTTFRYVLRPHGRYDASEAARFGHDTSRPLVAAAAAGAEPGDSWLRVEPSTAMVETLRPAGDGNGWVVRLFGAAGQPERVSLHWADPAPKAVYESDLTEQPGRRIEGAVDVPAWGLVTLRVIPTKG